MCILVLGYVLLPSGSLPYTLLYAHPSFGPVTRRGSNGGWRKAVKGAWQTAFAVFYCKTGTAQHASRVFLQKHWVYVLISCSATNSAFQCAKQPDMSLFKASLICVPMLKAGIWLLAKWSSLWRHPCVCLCHALWSNKSHLKCNQQLGDRLHTPNGGKCLSASAPAGVWRPEGHHWCSQGEGGRSVWFGEVCTPSQLQHCMSICIEACHAHPGAGWARHTPHAAMPLACARTCWQLVRKVHVKGASFSASECRWVACTLLLDIFVTTLNKEPDGT